MTTNADLWSATAKAYSTTIVNLTGQGGQALLRLVDSVWAFDDTAIVPDSGAGNGALTALLREKSSKMPIKATDIAPGMLEMLAKRKIPNLQTQILDATKDHIAQGLQQDHFTHALSTFMLQFISPPQNAITGMYRVLQPGGLIGNAIWSSSAIPDLWSKAVQTVNPTFTSSPLFSRGLQSSRDLEKLYATAGFIDVKSTKTKVFLELDNAEAFVEYFINGQNQFFTIAQSSWKSGKAEDIREALVQVVKEDYGDGKIPFVAACVKGQAETPC